MPVEDEIRAALEGKMGRSPTSIMGKVHGPVVVPPEKVADFAELKRIKDEILELARRFDQLADRF